MMDRQLTHMIRLVDDLLDVSRISRNQVELRIERIDLAIAIQEAIEESQPQIQLGRHELIVHLPSPAVWLDADPIRLAQVFANLINNAAKYTPEGGRIEVAARCEGEEVVVAVADNGIGIGRDMLTKVFDMFAQANRTLSRAQYGLGIGLTLVRRLVEMHGGRIEAESPGPGLGSTFTVRLPLRAERGPLRMGPKIEVGTAASEASAPQSAQKRVLVVDDSQDSADSLATLIRMLGHEVQTAYSGLAAFDAARSFLPHVVFLDLGLPGIDGCEVCQRMRSDPNLQAATIVALTGWGSDEYRFRTREAGFDHHLTKPIAGADVRAILQG